MMSFKLVMSDYRKVKIKVRNEPTKARVFGFGLLFFTKQFSSTGRRSVRINHKKISSSRIWDLKQDFWEESVEKHNPA